MLRIIRLAALTMLLLAPSLSQAFDGNRKGFLLGIGAGVQVSDIDTDPDTTEGLATSFRLGWGVTDRLMLYYLNNVSWSRLDGETILYGLSGFGASFYFSRTAPSFYLTSAIGFASLNDTDSVDNNYAGEGDGTGFMFGSGLELRKGMHLEAVVFHSTIETDRLSIEYDATTLQFLFNWVFY